ncbi:PAS domain-containing protein [Kriegella sp. EG-1]|nr:PAS domain-containing protein [Flavobacteriaceae bacterium EG-1]
MANIELDISHTLELLENVHKVANIGIFRCEVESQKIYWNEVLRAIYEVTEDFEPNLENVFNFIQPSNLQIELENAYHEAVEFGKSFELEHSIKTNKGKNRHIRTIGQPVFEKGVCIYVLGAVIDITKQINTELELAKQNQQLALSGQMTQIGYWRWDTITNKEIWSDYNYKIFGRKKGQKLSYDTYLGHVHPNDLDFVTKKINQAFIDKVLPLYSHRIVLENGTIKVILVAGQVITNEKDEVIEMLGTCQDITENKANEQQRHLLKIAESLTVAGSWQWNPFTQKFKWSDNLYQILGINKEKEITLGFYLGITHPDDIELVKSKMNEIIETKASIQFTHRLLLEDATQKILEVEAEPILTKKGEIELIIGSTQDITQKVNIENDLKETNQLLEFAEKLTTIAFWKYTPESDTVFWSDNHYEIFEQPKDEKLSFKSYFNRIHPDDQVYVSNKINQSIKDLKFYDFTHRILLESGEIKTIQVVGKVFYNEHISQLELLGISLDITESETKEKELIQKNQQLRIAEKMTMIGNWQWNPKTNEVIWSDNMYNIYEHDIKDPLSYETYLDYVHEEDKKDVIAKLSAGLQDGKFREATYRIRLKNGAIKTLKSVGKIIQNKQGEVIEMLGTCQDITERKEKEQELIQKNQELNFTEKLAKSGSWSYHLLTGEIFWSANLYDIFGYQKDSHITFELFTDCIHKDDKELVVAKFNSSINFGQPYECVYRIQLKDGTHKTLNSVAKIITNKNGQVVKMLGTCQDVTDNIKTQEKIIHKNQQLNHAEEIASLGSWEWQPDKDIFKWSDNLYRIYGIKLGEEMNIEKGKSRVHPEDLEQTIKVVKEILNGVEHDSFVHRIILDSGEIKTVEARAHTILDNEGNLKLIGTTQDITDAKNKEQLILHKNQQLNIAEEMAMIGSWECIPDKNILIWSDNLYRIHGMKPDAEMNIEIGSSRLHPDDLEETTRIVREILKGIKHDSFVHRIILDNGVIKTVESKAHTITDNDGNIKLIGTTQDITDAKNKEQLILHKNQQLNLAEELARLGSWEWQPDNNIYKWSDNLYRIYGLEPGVEINHERTLSRIHPEDLEMVKEYVRGILNGSQPDKFIHRVVLDNGDIRTLEIRGSSFKNKDGNLELIGTTQDITERKKVEQETLEKNHLLETAEKMTNIGSWKLNLKNNQLSWSDHLYKIFNLSLDIKITREIWLSFVHPDDKLRLKSQVENRLKKNAIKTLSYRIITKNGSIKTLKATSEVIKDNKNNPISITGTVQDITESIKKEQELWQMNQQLNEAEELASIGSFILNPKTHKFKWSDNSYRIYGFQVGIPMTFEKFLSCLHPDDYQNVADHYNGVLNFKTFPKIEYRVKHNNGNIKIVEAMGKVVLNDEGDIEEIIGTSRDITEQKEAENKILETNNRLEKITTELMARNRQLADFNQITSHNLRGPVSNLSSLLELHNESTDEDLKALLFSKFGVVIDHLTLTLNTLIDSLKIKNNENLVKLELSFEDTLVKTKEILVADILKTEAIIKSDFTITPTIMYNEIYLESIFLNLISNAIKYKSPDRKPEITISTMYKNGKTLLTIQDNGLGIDLERHGDKLFGLNKVFHRHPEALGIGLFLTKAQIEAMGGSIYAKSEVNKGTTFFVTLN